MDATESAALRELAQRPEWPVHELSAGIDADSLRCLDDRGLVEAAFVVLQNVRTRPGDTTPDQPVRLAWFSPIAQPQMAGGWDRIRGAAPHRAAMTATRIKRVLHDDPDGPYPRRAEEIVEAVELPEVPAFWIRLTERGRAELARLGRMHRRAVAPGGGVGWEAALRKAEAQVKRAGGKYPGRNELARTVGCSSSTMTKVIARSPYLRARKAEAGKGTVRTQPLRGDEADGGVGDPAAREAALARLTADQALERSREDRQHQAAGRRRTRPE